MRSFTLCTLFLLVGILISGCRTDGTAFTGDPQPTATPPLALPGSASGDANSLVVAATPVATDIPSATPIPVTPSATPASDPATRFEQARALDRIGSWEEAIALYDSLQRHSEFGTPSLYYMGIAYSRLDQQVEAAAAWGLALQRDPNHALAPALRYRLAKGLAAIGQHAAALELWGAADATGNAADALIAEQMAQSYQAMGDDEAALLQWQRVYNDPIGLRVNRALAAEQIADYYEEQQQWDDALTWYRRVLELSRVESFRADLLLTIGDIEATRGENERAAAMWQAVLDEHPAEDAARTAVARLEASGRTFTALERAQIAFANENYSAASSYYIEALAEPTHSAEGHRGLALSSEAAGSVSGAIQQWNELLTTHPEATALFPEALYRIGTLEAERGDSDAAFAAWNRLLADYPTDPYGADALWGMASSFTAVGDSDSAIAAWAQIGSSFPATPRAPAAAWRAGLGYYNQGAYATAATTFGAVSPQDSRPTRALFWAGKAAAAAGNTASAAQFWRQTIAADPTDYYALRAAAIQNNESWNPRFTASYSVPTVSENASWLPSGAPPSANPFLTQGLAALAMGERSYAYSSFAVAIENSAEEPAALWQIATTLYENEIYSVASTAARRLMQSMAIPIEETPPALGAIAYPLIYTDTLQAIADRHELDPLLLAAMIYQESRWEPAAYSSAAARGLLQVIPDTGRWIAQQLGDSSYRFSDLDRPRVALRYGAYYLDYLLEDFDDNPLFALAGYNGGPGNARRWATDDGDMFVERITFAETRSYIELVYSHYYAYSHVYR